MMDIIRRIPILYAAAIYNQRFWNRIRANRGILGPGLGPSAGGGTDSAAYCYSVWLRHLSVAYEHGLRQMPDVVAELGPGNSIGIGLAALISGASKYFALDTVRYSNTERNISVFDGLVELFREKRDIPDETEFPEVNPRLKSYKFPSGILSNEWLDQCLATDRIENIHKAILQEDAANPIQIRYFAPWYDGKVINDNSIVMLYSQAVLEHVEDLKEAYSAIYRWLKPGAYMSHQIDFRSHGKSVDWNGHWVYPDYVWKIVGQNYINRQPCSQHIQTIQELGFKILLVNKTQNEKGIQSKYLASRWKNISNEDLTCQSLFIVAKK